MHLPRLILITFLPIFSIFAHALDTVCYPTQSVLASGHWMKVETDTTGIFEISYDQLKEWGFPDPARVSVYGYGATAGATHSFSAEMPGDPVPAAAMHTPDGRILFYSEGDVVTEVHPAEQYKTNYRRNYYDTRTYYFLTDSRKAESPEESSATASDAPALRWHAACTLIEDEIQNPGHGGVFFHGKALSAGDAVSLPFTLSGYYRDKDAPEGLLRLELARKGESFSLGFSHSGNISVADRNTLSQKVNAYSSSNGIYSVQELKLNFSQAVNSTSGTASFTLKFPSDANWEYCAIEKAMIVYPQKIEAPKNNELIVNTGKVAENTKMIIADGGTGDLAVWNVSDYKSFKAYKVTPDNDGSAACTITGAGNHDYTRLVVFDKKARHRQIKSAAQVRNSNLHSHSTPNMVIVTTATMEDAAEELADIHRQYQGLDVITVRQDDIFNEFSGGSRTPAAIRRYLKMLYDRNPKKLHYVVLYGPSTYNNRGIGMPDITKLNEYIPVFEAERVGQAAYGVSNFGSDQYLGMVDDDFDIETIERSGRVELAVGRIPARTASEARIANEKIRTRLENPLPARIYLRSVLSGDYGDKGEHLKQANNDAETIRTSNPLISVARADTPFFYDPKNTKQHDCYGGNSTLDAIAGQLRTGVGLFSYCGHGSTIALGSAEIYDMKAVKTLKYKYLPFICQTTCLTYAFDSYTNNITEEMLFNPDGGAIASVSSCRKVYLSHNKQLSNALVKAYASATPQTCTGDLLVEARKIMMKKTGTISTTLGNNCMAYNLCGDPAIPLGAPAREIRIWNTEIEPLRPAAIRARVTDSDGNTIAGFSGPAVIDVYDVPDTLTSRDTYDCTVQSDNRILGTFQTMANNGIIETTIIVPAPSAEGNHRIIVTATDTQSGEEAAGILSDVHMTVPTEPYASDIDTSAPEITELYIDSPSFASGDVCSGTFTLTAIVNPSATGLKISTGNIRSASRAYLDNDVINGFMDRCIPDGNGNIRIENRFTDVRPGRHTFTLKLLNNAGEAATATLDFIVSDNSLCALTCDAGEVVRTAPVTFSVGKEEDIILSARITITSADGTAVRTAAMDGSTFVWDLKDNEGKAVADGEYTATALYESEYSRGGSNAVRLVVIK